MGLLGLGWQQPEGKRGLDRTYDHHLKAKRSIVFQKTSSHLHLDVGLGVAAAGLVARVRVAALALQAALRGGSDGLKLSILTFCFSYF